MQWVKFPNIDFTLQLKVCKGISNKNCADYYNVQELYKILQSIEKYELAGEYDPKKGFVIDPRISHYDVKEDRPYTTLNTRCKTPILWHSHPFDHMWNSYPSLEDLDMFRMYPKFVFLLLSKSGIYVISILKPYTSIDNLTGFYRSMQPETSTIEWNYEELEESFTLDKGFSNDKMKSYGIFIRLISYSDKNLLNKVIIDSFLYKDNSLQDDDVIDLLKKSNDF